jgi:hypothetical protein
MRAVLKAQINKTDRNDARGIAQMMRVGLYRLVHVKTLRSQKLRMLFIHRKLLQAKAIAVENDLRATLRNFGLKVGVVGTVKFEARVKELVENFPDLVALVEPLLVVFERDLIRERTGEGRKRALANGVKFGSKRKLSERGAMCQGQIFTGVLYCVKGSKAELAQTRMPVWSATKRPMILTVGFLDRKIVDASNSKAGKPVLIVLPILISVRTEPVAAVVVKLIGEANSNPIFTKGPDLLNEAIVQFARPFSG